MIQDYNVQNEMLLVFSLYKKPDLYAFYNDKIIKSQYDFKDEVARFFYDEFSSYYSTFSTTMSESKFNSYISQDKVKLKTYREYGGWATIKKSTDLCDTSDVEKYLKVVKKYSLVREYGKSGFPIDKIIEHKSFDNMSAEDIYKIMRVKTDKINTIISGQQEVAILGSSAKERILGFTTNPSFGVSFGWECYDSCFRGFRKKKFIVESMLSNEGKSRKMMATAVNLAMLENGKILIMSNEMTEEDIEVCKIVTIINHPILKKNFPFVLNKTEEEIVSGLYRDSKGEFIKRQFDKDGEPLLTDEAFNEYLLENSVEFNNTLKVMDWIEENCGNILFKDVSGDYSDDSLELEIRKATLGHGVDFVMYDTLKGYRTDEWSAVKQTASKLSELMKELDIGGYANYQLTDDSIYVDIFDFNSNNLANAKQVFHVLDSLTGMKRLFLDEYEKYSIFDKDGYGERKLDREKTYYGMKIMKSRTGGKGKVFAFEVNLDTNQWSYLGYLGLVGNKNVSRTPKGGKKYGS